jgi:protein-disulfide isomerase
MKRSLPFVIIGVLAVAIALAGVLMLRSDDHTKKTETSNSFYSYTPPPGATPPHAVGPETSAVTLEEFGDYQCPPCRAMFPEVKKIENDYRDQIRFVFRQNPLPQIHRHAIAAAHAAEAAGLQNRFWAMHDKLYENQETWAAADDPRPMFIEYARTMGLDVDRFTKDMLSQEVDDRLVEDHKRAAALGVVGTPTFFLNGQELKAATGGVTPVDIRAALDKALNKTH